MVNEIIFKTRVDTGNSVNDLKAVNTELKQIDTNVDTIGTDSAGQLEQLNKKIAAGGMSARELSRAIKEYMTIAIQAGTETPVGKEAIANASQLKDDLRGLGEEVSRLKDGAAGMQAALQLGGTIVAGYSVAQGTMAMFGVESEKLMETMVKLQSATAVLTGIQQIHANLEKESFLMLKAKTLQTKVMTAVTGIYSAVVGASTGALKLFRIALISTGIGAIIVAVGLLIANFDKLQGYVMKGYAAFDKLGTGIKIALGIIFPYIGAIYLAIKALKHYGIISDEVVKIETNASKARAKMIVEQTEARRQMVDEALADNKRMQQSITSNYDFEIAKAKAAGKDTYNLEKEKRAEMRKTLEAQILLLEESLKLQGGNAIAMMQIIKDMAAVRSAITQSEQQEEISAIQRSTDNRKKGAEQRKEIEKKQEEETAKALERERLLRDYFIASIDDENVRRFAQLQEEHNRERAELINKYGQDTELIKQLETKQALELSTLKKEITDEADAVALEANQKLLDAKNRDDKAALEARLLQIQGDFQAEMEVKALLAEMERDIALQNTELTENEKLLIKEKYNSDIRALEKESSDKAIELAKQEREQLIKISEQGLAAVTAVTDAVFANKLSKVEKGSKEELEIQKKQFKLNKAMQLSAAVMDGFKAINASLAQSPIAIGPVPNPAGIASLAFAAATSAANIAKIAATRFDGGSTTPPDVEPPSIGSPNIGAPELPSGTSTNTAGLINQPNKVVVVDSEIKAAMSQTQQIEVVSSFG
jgi:hypothetical protein